MRACLITIIIAAMQAVPSAWADNPTNVCKLDLAAPNQTDTVLCNWPRDPGAYPPPDITACQKMITVPTATGDDCGNAEFKACMENNGFQCTRIRTSEAN